MSSSEEAEEQEVLVVDNGSWSCKAGLAGDDSARAYVPTLLGASSDTEPATTYVGDRAKFDVLCPCVWSPMERGIVTNWDNMETVWEYVFTRDLCHPTAGANMLITEVPLNPRGNRDTMVQVLLEKFDVEHLCVCEPGWLALVSSGRDGGVVLDIGHGVTHVTAVMGGYQIPEATRRMDIGGYDVTMQLTNELRKAGYCFSTYKELIHVESLKHRLCNPDLDRRKPCRMPGTDIEVTITDGMAGCGDVLFDPALIGKSCPGIALAVYDSIMSCGVDIRRHMCANIVVTGGASMYPHWTVMKERITRHMASRMSSTVKINVVLPPERQKSSWIGGSIVGSLSQFPGMCRSRQDYLELGPSIFR